ncbi:hypothetical protein TTHERM_000405389 (macronuclear) [Tetrahymena thermophila SB210]|uniref:Uncharacterized protein n=1 Tax=Tetrahymena thermophila (strain SB210) TaxID=312017 RepID=W7X620_TETTS|nr:hypothetical protein TTHERM_000405389 [Tetrahymena thermophila SB210]EWS74800.1 hypothetical protein TTHERM_000405389 [Tetrahymena thermophila SB210]|eukprot:XP_012652693.1 hypothetical protein TTHERM_000405389 [Tetrahymena thermophila SB210]
MTNILLIYILTIENKDLKIEYIEVRGVIQEFLDYLQENSQIFSCRDIGTMFDFLQFFIQNNEEEFQGDNNQFQEIKQLVKQIMMKQLKREDQSIKTYQYPHIASINEYVLSVQSQDKNRENLLEQISKNDILSQISFIWILKYQKFGQIFGIQEEEELIFYIEQFIRYSQCQVEITLLNYFLIQIIRVFQQTKQQQQNQVIY